MSKSLTINAPQIVQTRNTLNAVPSGSTAEPDYSVKFVPQDLTEEQQAQARQNIGAAAAGEGGGATVNEFHYKRGGEEGSYYYYIDCQGYTPAEGDLMVVVFDWPMYPEHNPITLMNGSDNPSFVLLNAPTSEYNYYDDIEGTVNTRWMVKLEKVNNVWTAYNVNTIELADWNVTDPTAIGYIKNKPTISDPFPFFGNNNMLVIKSDRQTTFKTGGKFLDIWRNGVYEHLGSESDNIKSVTIAAGINYIKAAALGSEEFQDKNGNYVLYTPCVNTPLKINDTYNGSIKLISTLLRAPDHQCQTNNVIHILLNNYAQMTMSRLSTYTFTYVFTDTSFNIQWSGEIPSTVSATFYVPRNRYNQFVNLVNTQYPNDDTSVILNKVIVYDFIEWLDFEPVIKTYNTVPLTMTDANGNVITGDFIVYNLSITPAV